MKAITFPTYDRNEKDEVGRPSVVGRAWVLALMASANAPAGPNAERTAQVVRVYNQVKSLLRVENDERFMAPEGGFIYLEDAELKVFKESIDKFRDNVVGAQADALMWLDGAIAGATDVPKGN